jgi:hypothetical protein
MIKESIVKVEMLVIAKSHKIRNQDFNRLLGIKVETFLNLKTKKDISKNKKTNKLLLWTFHKDITINSEIMLNYIINQLMMLWKFSNLRIEMLRLNGFMQKANLMEIKELLEKKLKMFSMLCIKISFKSCLFITIEEIKHIIKPQFLLLAMERLLVSNQIIRLYN